MIRFSHKFTLVYVLHFIPWTYIYIYQLQQQLVFEILQTHKSHWISVVQGRQISVTTSARIPMLNVRLQGTETWGACANLTSLIRMDNAVSTSSRHNQLLQSRLIQSFYLWMLYKSHKFRCEETFCLVTTTKRYVLDWKALLWNDKILKLCEYINQRS